MNKTQLLKLLDRFFGCLACRVLPSLARSAPVGTVDKVLFIRPGGIGDAVLLIPAILALKNKYPDITVDVLAEKRNADVFSLCPEVADVWCYDVPASIGQLLRKRYDVIIDSEQWHRLSAVVARIIPSSLTIGFATNERARLFSCTVPYSHEDYEVSSFFRLLGPLFPTVSDQELSVPFLEVPAAALHKVQNLLRVFGGRRYVVISPGASIPERRWGSSRYAVLAAKLSELGIPVVIVGGTGDRSEGEAIIACNEGLNLAGETSLSETAAVISRGAVLVSGDSGILHLGVGLGISTVSLFGPGIQAKWAPRGHNHLVIDKSIPCSPCTKFGYTPKCTQNYSCLSKIAVEEVLQAVLIIWERSST